MTPPSLPSLLPLSLPSLFPPRSQSMARFHRNDHPLQKLRQKLISN